MKKRYYKPVTSVHEIALCSIIANSTTVGVYNNTKLDANESLSREDNSSTGSIWDSQW